MKKLLFLLAVFSSLYTNAQTYSISFSGTGLSTIKVQNLTTGVIVDVPAGDVLLLSVITGIPEVNNVTSSGLKVYPNPMMDKSILELLPPLAGDAIIYVCDMTGTVLTQYKGYIENCIQEFSLSGIKNGLHIITVQGNGYQFSEKLLSSGKSTGTANITRISNNNQAVAEKKSILNFKGVQGNVNMNYAVGQRLKYTAVSGNNSTVMTDIPTADKTVTFTFTECKDGDNNNYPVVQIGTQLWMEENLKTTKYNDGTTIPNITDNTAWEALTTGAYSDYDNTPANSTTYGRLYNWFAVDNNAATRVASNGGKNVCPVSWHVPGDAEWTILSDFLEGETIAGGKLKETGTTHWASPNTSATNETGFTALPGGYRDGNGPIDGHNDGYSHIQENGNWWSSAEYSSINARYVDMYHDYNDLFRVNYDKKFGYSVRCVSGPAKPSTYSISFSGTGLSTVQVQNLTTGVIVDVPAGDVLLLTAAKGISKVNNMKSAGLKVAVEKKSILDFKGVQSTVYMAYSNGERLKYTAVSGNNSTVMTDIPTADETVTFTFTECKDGDNNHYPVVQIGTQLWMAENLKTTTYNEGTAIPNITVDATWEATITGAFCDYDNTAANSTTFGRLYNWYAVDNNAATMVASNAGKNVCPVSWHVPSDAEWTTLTTFLGETFAGDKLKEPGKTHWLSPNTDATNETGFTTLPGGFRDSNGSYGGIYASGLLWSSTEVNPENIWGRWLSYNFTFVGSHTVGKQTGYSVRCIRDF